MWKYMNQFNFTAIMQVVNKLGWNDMPADVCLDAIWQIVCNRHNVIADCCDESLCTDTILEDMSSDEMTSNILWLDLFVNDYQTLSNLDMQHKAESLRWEIERDMRSGMKFSDARREWDI